MTNLHDISVREVRGIGEARAEELAALNIRTVAELLDYFPFRYEDYRLRSISEVLDGEKITIEGEVYGDPYVQMYGQRKSRMTCVILTESVLITTVWFNRHFMRQRLKLGQRVIVTGKWDRRRLQLTVAEAEFPGARQAQAGALQPVYSLSGAVAQKWLRTVIRQALKQYGEHIVEVLPESLLKARGLMPRRQAVMLMHQPGDDAVLGKRARERIVYEELFLFQLKLQALRSMTRSQADGVVHQIDQAGLKRFVESLPFQLTSSQKQVINEIVRDLQQPYCMNRLLQGDVGSGKTVVAAVALFAVVKGGTQGALMVPTEILAEQHAASLRKLFEPFDIEVAVLTGSMKEREKREVLASLQSGLTDIVVGTHALIQEGVFFRRLGLVVTDEQHRFGVNQRSILRRKGMNPDVLTMTATPIPRTLAITAFGDMDVSTLRELPQGRKPISTYWVQHHMLQRILRFIEKEMRAGRQAYIICPLIEESEKLDVQNAIELYERLVQVFAQFKVGLLHGRMTAGEKEGVMRAFGANEVQLLVSTTVVEVGVDVPNATIMVVYDAERFGLSQLHQLRGRVGRGVHQSYCILIADPQTEVGKERMRVMTETNDGFEIARNDLKLRGPGEFFGTRQSGVPQFRVADIMSDFAVMEQARDDAATLMAQKDFWTSAAYVNLREHIQRDEVFRGDLLD